MTSTYKARKEAGLCVMCGNVKNPGNVYCEKCRQYMRHYEKERKQRLLAEGLCIKCGKQKENPNAQKCSRCNQRAAEYMWKHRNRKFGDE